MLGHLDPTTVMPQDETHATDDDDAITRLAFSVYGNPRVYALLLGSGLSRAAGIPTGWEVTLDLTRRVALAQGEDDQQDWAAWYCCFADCLITDFSDYFARWVRGFPTVFRDRRKMGRLAGCRTGVGAVQGAARLLRFAAALRVTRRRAPD